MALFYAATVAPTKAELISTWLPSQSWGPSDSEPIEVVGAFRFDDPEGQTGIETHIVRAGQQLFQVPMTYRDAPLDGCEDHLMTTMEHSVLGTRWVYDGLYDDRYILTLAGAALTGQGEALGFVNVDGEWHVIPAIVRITAGGWSNGQVSIHGLTRQEDNPARPVFKNDHIELSLARKLTPGPQPKIGITASWDGQPDPVVLATITQL